MKAGTYDKMRTAIVWLLPDGQHYIWMRSHWRARTNSSCSGKKTIPDRTSVHTHRNDDFRAISVTERSCSALISKVERHTDWIGPVPHFGAV